MVAEFAILIGEFYHKYGEKYSFQNFLPLWRLDYIIFVSQFRVVALYLL